MKGKNMMSPAHKTHNDAYRENYEKTFRKPKRKSSRDPITKKEIADFKKEYAKTHNVIGSDPPKPVKLNDRTAELLIQSGRRYQEWLDSVHPSHDMNEWHGEIRSPVGTARMYSVRQCKNCEYEQSEHPAGRFMDHQLTKQCWSI